jgi:hypothetical protein
MMNGVGCAIVSEDQLGKDATPQDLGREVRRMVLASQDIHQITRLYDNAMLKWNKCYYY